MKASEILIGGLREIADSVEDDDSALVHVMGHRAEQALVAYEIETRNDQSNEKCSECGNRTTYQGWPNHETWAVALIVDNTEMVQRRVTNTAQGYAETYEAADAIKQGMERDFQDIENALELGITALIKRSFVGKFAKDRKEYLLLLAKQLLQDAIEDIDWQHMAETYRNR